MLVIFVGVMSRAFSRYFLSFCRMAASHEIPPCRFPVAHVFPPYPIKIMNQPIKFITVTSIKKGVRKVENRRHHRGGRAQKLYKNLTENREQYNNN